MGRSRDLPAASTAASCRKKMAQVAAARMKATAANGELLTDAPVGPNDPAMPRMVKPVARAMVRPALIEYALASPLRAPAPATGRNRITVDGRLARPSEATSCTALMMAAATPK